MSSQLRAMVGVMDRKPGDHLLNVFRAMARGGRDDGAPDSELLCRYAVGRDEAAFATLVKRHTPMVLGVARRVVGGVPDAEDVCQATFLLLARRASGLGRESIAGWLCAAARLTALNARKARGRRALAEARSGAEAARVSSTTPLEQLTWGEAVSALDEELSRLPDRYRGPLVLCCLEGLARDEAARRLGVPAGTFRVQLERGRKRLRAALERRGIELGAALLAVLVAPSVGIARARLTESVLAAVGGKVPPAIEVLCHGSTAMMKAKLFLAAAFVVGLAWTVGVGVSGFPRAPEARAAEPAQPVPPQKTPAPDVKPAPVRLLKDDFRFLRIAWGPDARLLAGVTFEPAEGDDPLASKSAVRLWDAKTGAVKRTLVAGDRKKEGAFQHVAVSPDGKMVAAASDRNGDEDNLGLVTIWDAETGALKHTLKQSRFVRAVAFSPDGKTVATATGGNLGHDVPVVQLWDAESGELRRDLEATDAMAVQIAFSPDGKALAVVLQLRTDIGQVPTTELTVWDTSDGKLMHTLSGLESVRAVTFSDDGKTLFAAALDKFHACEVKTGKLSRSVDTPHDFSEGSVSAFAFSPGGAILAVAGKRREKYSIALWDVTDGKLLRTLDGSQEKPVHSLAFARNGKMLASASEDRTVRLWDLGVPADPKKSGNDEPLDKQGKEGAKDKPAPAAKAKTDQELLQGTWQIVSVESGGQTRDVSGQKYTFRGDQTVIDWPKMLQEGTFRIDTTQNPKWIEFNLEFAPRKQLGVYQFDGDKLLICWGISADQRPTDLATNKNASTYKYRLERVTKNAKATDPTALEYSEARRRSGGYMRGLGAAMHAYVDRHGHFPMPAIYSKDGKPLLSWRVALLPHIGHEKLYQEFRLDEPWDSAHNMKLLARIPKIYAPLGPAPKDLSATYYQVFVGDGAMFEAHKEITPMDVTDGTSSTILVVEAGEPVPWTKPADIAYDANKPIPQLGLMLRDGWMTLLAADGSSHTLKHVVDKDLLRDAITRNGNEDFEFSKFDR